ncbi:Clp protease N-terminal domain-containing protein [Actinomadura hibisca]|uniref:Clp protease N-terminal domain-containing protein n=1 Tax=Actinomadura hibisca TaxID=68565 RepID=UPI0008356052|nr:Clp protease N-terminal domain-containing protein [Actinomadura hibisca]
MFERFTEQARAVVVDSQQEARDLGHRRIGTEHLLLALAGGDGPGGQALRAQGLAAGELRARVARLDESGDDPLDAEALRTLGIDLDAVREATESRFGEGALDSSPGRFRRGGRHVPFTAPAKKTLELSLQHAIRLKSKEIGDGHLLLGLLHDRQFLSVRLLFELGVDADALRADVTRRITAAAA